MSRSIATMLAGSDLIRVPRVWPELSTARLLTLDWLEGGKHARPTRRRRSSIATGWRRRCSRPGGFRSAASASSTAIRISAITACSRRTACRAASTCSIMAASAFSRRASSAAWSISITGLRDGDEALVVHAYETWGFKQLSRELIDILNIWARFIYGPLLDDRVRSIADGVKPGEYGRREAFRVHQALKAEGPGDGAARIRVHGPRRHRPRRGVPASAAPS